MNADPDLAARFDWFADWCEGTSPLYERLARGVAEDDELLALAAAAPAGRSPPHLLFAAVHFLLLDGRDHRLAEHYPTCTDDPATGDPFPAFREFCDAHEGEIREFLADHRTQTNSVRRCAALFPAFSFVSRKVGSRPLALVEFGASGGLNLRWDEYGYDYGEHGRFGPDEAPITISSEIRGEVVPPFPDEPPAVDSRVGIDLHPLDLREATDLHVLRSFIWPEHADRHRFIREAAAVVRERPPELVEGDAIETLPDVVESIPRETPVCVYDTQVRYQMDDEQEAALRGVMADLGAERELHWLSGDEAVEGRTQGIRLDWTTYDADGTATTEPLAAYEQHGKWVEWLRPGE